MAKRLSRDVTSGQSSPKRPNLALTKNCKRQSAPCPSSLPLFLHYTTTLSLSGFFFLHPLRRLPVVYCIECFFAVLLAQTRPLCLQSLLRFPALLQLHTQCPTAADTAAVATAEAVDAMVAAATPTGTITAALVTVLTTITTTQANTHRTGRAIPPAPVWYQCVVVFGSSLHLLSYFLLALCAQTECGDCACFPSGGR